MACSGNKNDRSIFLRVADFGINQWDVPSKEGKTFIFTTHQSTASTPSNVDEYKKSVLPSLRSAFVGNSQILLRWKLPNKAAYF
jgi:hypothetical protein